MSERSEGRRFNRETAAEAGGRGGAKILAERGPEYFRELGRRGGQKMASIPGHMSALGKKGGKAPRRERVMSDDPTIARYART